MRVRALALGFLVAVPLAVLALTEATAATSDFADWATPVGALPAKVDGSTKAAHVRKDAPVPSCAAGQGVVWYTATARAQGPMLATATAGGDSDAALVVYRLVRSKAKELLCVLTDRSGSASVPWYGYPGQSYLIGVARRAGSPAGPFQLSVASREPLPRPPGAALPAEGTSETVTPVLDAADAWAVSMQRGTSYKINLASPRGCIRLDIYRPGSYRFVDANHAERGTLPCAGYLMFTPGVDGGGTYSLVVKAAGSKTVSQPYRLMVAEAGTDDSAPGVALTSGQAVTGLLDSKKLDVADLYSFTVPRNGSLTTIDFLPSPKLKYDLLLLDETGGPVTGVTRAHGRQALEKKIRSGRYFLSVRALHQTGGTYRLSELTREITSTTMLVDGAQFVETSPGASVSLQVYVAAASHGGDVAIEIDRFDPIFGWQFSTLVPGSVDLGGRFTTSWTPPWAGHWRALARFPGNIYSTPSMSDHVRVHVAAPLES